MFAIIPDPLQVSSITLLACFNLFNHKSFIGPNSIGVCILWANPMLHQSYSIHGDTLNELCPRHSPGPVLLHLVSLTDITLTGTMLQLDQPLCLFYNHRTHFCKNLQETLRNKIQYSQVPEVTQNAQNSHSEITGREKNRERERDGLGLSLPLLQSESEISRVPWDHSLLANLKHKYRMGHGKRHSNSSLGSFKQLSRLPWGSERGTFTVMELPSSLSGCFAGSCVIQLHYV